MQVYIESLCFYLPQTLNKYKAQLAEDPIVRAHLNSLYDSLLEQNLCRIIEPFSHVQVKYKNSWSLWAMIDLMYK